MSDNPTEVAGGLIVLLLASGLITSLVYGPWAFIAVAVGVLAGVAISQRLGLL